MTSEQSKKMLKARWGDKLSCRIFDRDGIRLAICMFNGDKYEGRGKSNIKALEAIFKKIG